MGRESLSVFDTDGVITKTTRDDGGSIELVENFGNSTPSGNVTTQTLDGNTAPMTALNADAVNEVTV